MPMLVRGFCCEGWQPSRAPYRDRSLEDFLQVVRTGMHGYSEPDAVRA